MRNNIARFLVVLVLLIIASFFSLNLYFEQKDTRDSLDIRNFPYTIGEWQGKDLEVTEKEYDILGTRNLVSREYINSSSEKIYLFIIYSETNRMAFHPPEVCMMGGGTKIVDKRSVLINSSGYNFSVNKLYIQKDKYRGMALYCYKAGNLYTDNFYLQQALFALNQLSEKHRGGATVRVSMSMDKEEQVCFETLKEFIVEAVKIVDNLPEQS